MPNLKDITGKKFSRLLVKEQTPFRSSRGGVKWKCVCDCGKETIVESSALTCGKIKSCGCSRGTHKMSKSSEFSAWQSMKDRCTNPKAHAWGDYGARGIKVCDLWLDSFQAFLNNVGLRPSRNHTLDRIDNNLGYFPGNCRWTTMKVQCRNRRNNVFIEYDDGIRMPMSEYCEARGISRTSFWYFYRAKQLSLGAATERAVKVSGRHINGR